jgi:S-DNA-T family DNA segregation ATPase FtsK/SpoIIIE
MAQPHLIETDDHAIPAAVRRFLRHRLMEAAGLALLAAIALVAASLASWSIADPSLNNAIDAVPHNWLGAAGAIVADELMQRLGLGALVVIVIPVVWAVTLIAHRPLDRPIRRLVAWLGATVLAAAFFAVMPVPPTWALGAGLGGSLGDVVAQFTTLALSFVFKGVFADIVAGVVFFASALVLAVSGAGLSGDDVVDLSVSLGEASHEFTARTLGAAGHMWIATRGFLRRRLPGLARLGQAVGEVLPSARSHGTFARTLLGRWRGAAPHRLRPPSRPDDKIEPCLVRDPPRPRLEPQMLDAAVPGQGDVEEHAAAPSPPQAAPRIQRGPRSIRQGRRIRDDAAPPLPFETAVEYRLPPLTLLAEPKAPSGAEGPSDDTLEQNARMLEGVLEDFGVRGDIIHVRPGPVVTLYELEPAPGIKSSRVIGLSDDIARSMSAVSCRVAVVPGRNVIGIELPNARRETVFLRELLASQAFEKTSQTLALALGKNIGGEPVLADLARMPHLLIAGTTGSGKSVGINTMILSLVYRLAPDECKLIMIDPKMLELSVYEGIPHLLSPVVTDPRKAVVALKWVVREMEDRYRKMSKLGVRNIDGYNARAREAQRNAEVVTRTVQTGFDPETGEPVFEHEEMGLEPLPYIVVIIDEMADLMMVAGKEIEGAVQRLAQMARAAGIHVVMATQRPSVDVITGTIKANFPTRISFQVTSKIDSRTILGEQGAEQLLGQGDMLYMAGGGRISRLHGAFVADAEVERIVDFLKAQGTPRYVEAVTEEADEEPYVMAGLDGEGEEEEGNDLYDRAVAVVLRDRKVSTSYVQRRLQIGYNRAASLIERMEKEGLISTPGHTGRREILAGNPDAGEV